MQKRTPCHEQQTPSTQTASVGEVEQGAGQDCLRTQDSKIILHQVFLCLISAVLVMKVYEIKLTYLHYDSHFIIYTYVQHHAANFKSVHFLNLFLKQIVQLKADGRSGELLRNLSEYVAHFSVRQWARQKAFSNLTCSQRYGQIIFI